ncbi:MAG: 5-formyltetrahydrofolate cyclo-ligase [Pseudohongiellaceae bacterium]
MTEATRTLLRQSTRQARHNLSAEAQELAAAKLYEQVTAQDFFNNANIIAFYQTIDGEISPQLLLNAALQAGKSCYLPIIEAAHADDAAQDIHDEQEAAPASSDNDTQLITFAPVTETTVLQKNKWGIAEPPAENRLPPAQFDLMLIPLVAFDTQCNRLGLGKGFYDKTLAFKHANPKSKPLLVGLAHECQLLDNMPTTSHDVRLDAVVTDRKIYLSK